MSARPGPCIIDEDRYVFIDEIDKLPKQEQDALLHAIEHGLVRYTIKYKFKK